VNKLSDYQHRLDIVAAKIHSILFSIRLNMQTWKYH